MRECERKKAEGDLELPNELGSRDGPEPELDSDWERKEIVVDY